MKNKWKTAAAVLISVFPICGFVCCAEALHNGEIARAIMTGALGLIIGIAAVIMLIGKDENE